jgi:hypothetical protein
MQRNLSLLAFSVGLMTANVNQAWADPSRGQASEAERSDRENGDDDGVRVINYTAFKDLTGVNALKTGGLRYTFGPLAGGGFGFSTTAVEPFGSGVAATYDASSGNITYQTVGGTSVTFTAADEVLGQSTPQSRQFFKPNPAGGVFGGSLSTPSVNTVPLTYTRFGTFFTTGSVAPLDGHAFVLGVPTLARDMPKRGTATYATSVGGTAFAASAPFPMQLTGSTASFSANFARGTITTGLNLIGTPVNGGAAMALDTLSGVGSISSTKPGFAGLFTGTGTVKGNFSGAFFGPKAVEFGYDFLVGGTNGAGRQFTAIGGVAGTTAPPPPPPAYTPFQNLTGVQNFASAGIGYTIGAVPSGGVGFVPNAIETFGSSVAVQYDTATGNVTYTAPNGASTTFTAADEVPGQSTPVSRVFVKPNPAGGVFSGSISVPSINGVPLSYTRLAYFYTAGPTTNFDGRAFTFGVQTQASDVPTTGTATYTGNAGGVVFLATGDTNASLAGSTASLIADFSTGSIATALALLVTPTGGVQTPLDVLVGAGSLGAVKPGFSGSLTGSGTVAGSFNGAFFGPQAAEFGYDFLVGGTTAGGVGFTAIGAAVGTKP